MIDAATLQRDCEVCCVLNGSLDFLYCNPAWDQFAQANGGTPEVFGAALMHRNLLQFVPEVLKTFFINNLYALRPGRSIWHHRYECSSPSEFRVFELQALRLADEDEILICHSPITCRPHNRTPVEPPREPAGVVRMCCHCRRTCLDSGSGIWEWVPEYVARAPKQCVADLCRPCADYYRHGGVLT
jgi:hypothetical protein